MFEIVRSDNATFDKLWLDLWNKDKIQHPYYQPFTRAWFKEFEPKSREVGYSELRWARAQGNRPNKIKLKK